MLRFCSEAMWSPRSCDPPTRPALAPPVTLMQGLIFGRRRLRLPKWRLTKTRIVTTALHHDALLRQAASVGLPVHVLYVQPTLRLAFSDACQMCLRHP
eukprot:scaffold705_cov402-Prasinococcus_capsulatus_cf.AAC.25